MKYKFVSLVESGNGTDFIMAVEEQPNPLERLLGRHAERVEFFGPHPYWVTMDGRMAIPPVERELERLWNDHPQRGHELSGAGAWKVLEPNANVEHAFD